MDFLMLKRQFRSFLVVSFLVALAPLSALADSEQMKKARDYLNEGNYKDALDIYKELQNSPSDQVLLAAKYGELLIRFNTAKNEVEFGDLSTHFKQLRKNGYDLAYVELLEGMSLKAKDEVEGDKLIQNALKRDPELTALLEKKPLPTPTPRPTATAGNFEISGETFLAELTSASNVRAGPGTDYSKYGPYPTGTVVRVLGKVTKRRWYQITNSELARLGNVYIATHLVSRKEDAPDTLEKAETAPPRPERNTNFREKKWELSASRGIFVFECWRDDEYIHVRQLRGSCGERELKYLRSSLLEPVAAIPNATTPAPAIENRTPANPDPAEGESSETSGEEETAEETEEAGSLGQDTKPDLNEVGR